MPDFGRDGILKPDEIPRSRISCARFAGLPVDPKADIACGAKIFGGLLLRMPWRGGRGNRDLGAPNLTDAIWLYGPDKATIIETITKARRGMPAWSGRLDDTTIKALTVFVSSFGGGEK